tara:strand:+ start:108 stop:635 length:528 start_codon:yes stop_codon:yes gene_type:complete
MAGILPNLGGLFGGGSPGNGFAQILTYTDFQTANVATDPDITLSTTEFKKLGTFTVGAQRLYHWGSGTAAEQQNQGYIYMANVDDQGTTFHGTVRFIQSNAQETQTIVVIEKSTRNLNGSQTVKDQQIPLPEQTQFPLVGEDSKLIVEMKGEAAHVRDTSDTTNNIWLLPVTAYQ